MIPCELCGEMTDQKRFCNNTKQHDSILLEMKAYLLLRHTLDKFFLERSKTRRIMLSDVGLEYCVD